MAKYIDAEAAKVFLREEEVSDDITFLLECVSAADVEPVRHGRWVAHDDFWRKCSECGKTWHEQWVISKALNYCPNCGAKMDEEVAK